LFNGDIRLLADLRRSLLSVGDNLGLFSLSQLDVFLQDSIGLFI
jgi:hypothetical protein